MLHGCWVPRVEGPEEPPLLSDLFADVVNMCGEGDISLVSSTYTRTLAVMSSAMS